MKWLAPLLVAYALLRFTDPSGAPLYVAAAQIIAVGAPVACDPRAGAKITTSSGSFCVRESVETVVTKVNQ
jgi:hypothetical protein